MTRSSTFLVNLSQQQEYMQPNLSALKLTGNKKIRSRNIFTAM